MMSSRGKKQQNLVGKLLLSTALVAVSLAYGWWQRHNMAGPDMAAAPNPKPLAANTPVRNNPAMTARAEPVAPATKAAPDASAGPPDIPGQTTTPRARPETATAARTAPDAKTPAAVPAPVAAPSGQDAPASPLPLTALAELRMYQPPPAQIPLPLVTGTPAPGTVVPIAQGMHLQDGNYLSDRQQYEWGDLQVKILVYGGQITGVQIVQYPDHRAESLQLSQMASPILNSEVIQTQQSKVDVVSSATDTSYVYQDAIANAIFKATRQ